MKKLKVLKRLTRSKEIGIGSEASAIGLPEMTRLNHTYLDKYDYKKFLKHCYSKYKYKHEIEIKLRNYTPKWRLGSAFTYEHKILLYRHSVWIFLHELAHCIVDNLNPEIHEHGRNFGNTLAELYKDWKRMEERLKLNNIKVTYKDGRYVGKR